MDEAFKDSVCLGHNNRRFSQERPLRDVVECAPRCPTLSSDGPGRQRSRAS